MLVMNGAQDINSRLKQQVSHLFDCFFELRPCKEKTTAQIVKKYPCSFEHPDICRQLPHFCYPCDLDNEAINHFSFVFTSLDSNWTFGFCRHSSNSCLLLLSSLPWHDTFYRLLNYLANIIRSQDVRHLQEFLRNVYYNPVPKPGNELLVQYIYANRPLEFRVKCADSHKIPSIPEDRNLTEFYNAVNPCNMISLFASMLHERRIVITSHKPNRLSACVQAAQSLLYPMQWQHIFIPIMPSHLLDYLNAPMPFLVGVPLSVLNTHPFSDAEEIVLLNLDTNHMTTEFDDLSDLPTEVVCFLKKSLKNPTNLLGDGIARIFLRALVMLIGGYRDALRFIPGQKITFNEEQFVLSRKPPMQPFLRRMLQLQLFRQFVEHRLAVLNAGDGMNDEFEQALNTCEVHSGQKFKHAYKAWASNLRRESGAMLRSVHPVMRSAYKNLKDKSKRAYKDIRHRIVDINNGRSSSIHLGVSSSKSQLNLAMINTPTRSASLDVLHRTDFDLLQLH